MKTIGIALSMIFLFAVNGYTQIHRGKNQMNYKYSKNDAPKNKLLIVGNLFVPSNDNLFPSEGNFPLSLFKPLGFSLERNILQFGKSKDFTITLGCYYSGEAKTLDQDKERHLISDKGNMRNWKIEPYFKFYLGSNHNFNIYLFGSFVVGSQVMESEYRFDTTEYNSGGWFIFFWWDSYYENVTDYYYKYTNSTYTGTGVGFGLNHEINLNRSNTLKLCLDLSFKYYKYWSEKFDEIPENATCYNERYQENKSYYLADHGRGHIQNFIPQFALGLKF